MHSSEPPRKRKRDVLEVPTSTRLPSCERHRISPDSPYPCPFRLFTIDGWNSKGLLEVSVHEGHDSHNTDGYQALSYAWLGQPQNMAIISNGSILNVTYSLHTFLTRLKVLYVKEKCSERRFFWTDQICISQNRLDDKERQVPAMDTYFSQADAVLIWLGHSNSLIDMTLEMVENVLENLADLGEVRNQWQRGHLPPELPAPLHFFWQGLGIILMNPWWLRLWTLQEIALAKRTTFYCGSASADLADLLVKLFRLGMMPLINAPGLEDGRKTIFPRALYAIEELGTKMPISELISIARRRQCARDIDKVYATLGLALPATKALFRIRYSAHDGESDYAQAWIEWALLAIMGRGYLLLIYEAWTRQPGLPSWCPNLNSPVVATRIARNSNPSTELSRDKGRSRENENLPFPYAITRDKSGLICQGWVLDVVEKVVGKDNTDNMVGEFLFTIDKLHSQWPDVGNESKNGPVPQTGFLSRFWALARETSGKLGEKWVEFLRTITGDKDPEYVGRPGPMETYDLIQRWTDLTAGKRSNGLKESDIESGIRAVCTGRNFFVTQKDRMGIGPIDVQPGDLVCSFDSAATALFTLRSIDRQEALELDPLKGNTGCTFLGEAHVQRLMYQDVYDEKLHEEQISGQFFTMY